MLPGIWSLVICLGLQISAWLGPSNQARRCRRTTVVRPGVNITRSVMDDEAMAWIEANTAQQPLDVSPPPAGSGDNVGGEPGRYRVLVTSSVSRELDPDSLDNGVVYAGLTLTAEEVARVSHTGLPRMRFSQGWVSEIGRDGKIWLERIGDEEAQLAEALQLAGRWAQQDVEEAARMAEEDMAAFEASLVDAEEPEVKEPEAPTQHAPSSALAARRQQPKEADEEEVGWPDQPSRGQKPAGLDVSVEPQQPRAVSSSTEKYRRHLERRNVQQQPRASMMEEYAESVRRCG
jgi:hypothetical protein